MIFRNPLNNATEVVSMPVAGTLIFGAIYLLLSGLWAPAFMYLIAIIIAVVILGNGIFYWLAIIAIWIGFAICSPGFFRKKYRRLGWIEDKEQFGAYERKPTHRKCPKCAETILSEAAKCKHCGSMVDPLPEPVDPYSKTETVSVVPTTGLPINEHIDRVVAVHGAKRKGDSYRWNNQSYSSFADLVEAINNK